MSVRLTEGEYQELKAANAALTADNANLRQVLDHALTEWELTVQEFGHVGRTPDFGHLRREAGLA